ncbi:MAG: transporter [Cytophagaceae bacterium]|nr:transporter [Cytophagaceae bacterium]|tara:strand:- start:1319 stop:2035 length:717 start_codon:yes stop_codon:yes gene_type:complete
MDNFQIETAQNVTIQQNVAGVGDRILAFLLDSLIMLGYIIISSLIISVTPLADAGGEWVYGLVLGIPTLLYYLLWETLWSGRTPGKAALNIRVVKLDGSKPGLGSFFIRWIMRVVDISLTSGGIAVFTILFNGKGQRLGDLAAGTTVISEKKKVGLSHTLLEDIPQDYIPRYPQVTVFSDKDIQKIKTIYRGAKRNGNHNVIIKLGNKIASNMKVTPEETPIHFVDRVLKDYNYYTQQ